MRYGKTEGERQTQAMDKLVALGYAVRQTYGDGVVRMAMYDSASDQVVGVFVRPDGTISPPHTAATQTQQAILKDAGLTTRLGGVQ